MTEEEKAIALEKRRKSREEKLLQGAEPIEVADKVEEGKKSLFEKFTGTIQNVTPKKTRRTKKVDPTIITKVAPLVVSSFAVSFIRQRVQEPYKVCCPTQEEVVLMIQPYFNILSRYVEITGHLSENTVDMISAILASVIYATRAYVTFVNIKEYQENDRSSNDGLARTVNISTIGNIATNRNNLQGTDSEPVTRNTEDTSIQEPNITNGATDDIDFNSSLSRYEAEKLGNLFKRDLDGRRRLGLL